jgi:plasmid maintenance system antidote protein VapI
MARRNKAGLEEVLRNAVKGSGSVNAVAKAVGVSQPSLCNFVNGGGLNLDTVQRLMDHFGMTVTETKAKRKGRKHP